MVNFVGFFFFMLVPVNDLKYKPNFKFLFCIYVFLFSFSLGGLC